MIIKSGSNRGTLIALGLIVAMVCIVYAVSQRYLSTMFVSDDEQANSWNHHSDRWSGRRDEILIWAKTAGPQAQMVYVYPEGVYGISRTRLWRNSTTGEWGIDSDKSSIGDRSGNYFIVPPGRWVSSVDEAVAVWESLNEEQLLQLEPLSSEADR